MIFLWTGKTGSGKTFNMVATAFEDWKNGRNIYSNTLLFFDDYAKFSLWEKLTAKLFRRELKRGTITYFETIEEIIDVTDGVILFDEGQVLFNARNWESLPAEFQYKLEQHRKHVLDLYCTTQNIKRIDINYRRLVQEWWQCEPVYTLFGFRLHRRNQKDVDELDDQSTELKVPVLRSKLFWITRWSRVLYDTYFDIGFKRFKTIYITKYDEQIRKKSKFYIIPKQLQFKDALRAIKQYETLFEPKKTYVKKNI